jgi:formamidopyrimidine-DNA glycosylase
MMTGVWRLLPASREPRPGGLFLALWTATHVAALYRCPRVRLLEPTRQVGEALVDQRVVAGVGNV